MRAGFRRSGVVVLALMMAAVLGVASAHAAERVTLTNGYDVICDHRAPAGVPLGSRVRLYMDADGKNFIEVDPAQIESSEVVKLQKAEAAKPASPKVEEMLTPAELHQMLASAGEEHDLNADLL